MTTAKNPFRPEVPEEWPPRLRWTADEMARFNTWLGNPALCRRKSCGRHGRCLGEPLGCLQSLWRKRPEAAKIWMQSALAARDAGRTEREAARLADAAMMSFVRRIAGLPVGAPDGVDPPAPPRHGPGP